jgi:hypothetical protein
MTAEDGDGGAFAGSSMTAVLAALNRIVYCPCQTLLKEEEDEESPPCQA